ncbi:O-antigen ligase family protein [Alteribacillus sp. HJP-4]|uniref:O-antigen ligase family protein n=1 Tax=Alteribacillus sp. HJP-4 TaxID=2775394 RepID=UPI0035CD3723
MAQKKIVLFLLITTFLSGDFSITLMNFEKGIEVRYLLFFLFLISFLILINFKEIVHKKTINKNLTYFVFITIVYFFISFLTIFQSRDMEISLEKVYDIFFLLLLIISLVIVLNAFEKREFFNFLAGLFILVGIIYAIPIFLSVSTGAERGNFNFSGPNVTTRVLFFAACCAIFKYTLTKRLKYSLLIIFFLIGIILVGSRGGIVGAAVTLTCVALITLIFKWKNKGVYKFSIKKLSIVIVSSLLILTTLEQIKRVFLNRMVETTFAQDKIYTAGRDIIYDNSINMISKNPLWGYGLNGYSIETGENYPHNLLLELMIDTGLPGFFFFIFLLITSFYLPYRLKNSEVFIFSSLPFYMVIVHMFSGNLYDFRYFYLWVIPLIYFSLNTKKVIFNSKFF